MSTTIQLRRGTAAQWTAANPVLNDGEPGFEDDTHKFKIGDGVTAWNALAYAGSGSFVGGTITGAVVIDQSNPNVTDLQINQPAAPVAYPFLIVADPAYLAASEQTEARWFMAHPEGGLCLTSLQSNGWATLHIYKAGPNQGWALVRITTELATPGGAQDMFVVGKDGQLFLTNRSGGGANFDILRINDHLGASLLRISEDGGIAGKSASALRSPRDIIEKAMGLKVSTGQPANGQDAAGSGEVRLTAVGLRGGETYTAAKTRFGAAANLTLAKFVIVDANNTVVAVSGNEAANLNGLANQAVTIPLAAPFTPAQDGIYYIGLLGVGTAPPEVIQLAGGNGLDMTINGQMYSWRSLGHTDATTAVGQVLARTGGNIAYWWAL
jgi:hypothetical protein